LSCWLILPHMHQRQWQQASALQRYARHGSAKSADAWCDPATPQVSPDPLPLASTGEEPAADARERQGRLWPPGCWAV